MREQTEPERGTPPEWLPYFTVESVDDVARQAERAGARLVQPTTVTDSARLAVIEDPQGAAFAAFEGETDP
jgi:predicted enzyme related to lactoylglutathione lyase